MASKVYTITRIESVSYEKTGEHYLFEYESIMAVFSHKEHAESSLEIMSKVHYDCVFEKQRFYYDNEVDYGHPLLGKGKARIVFEITEYDLI